jgi:hypothetical protein
VLHSKHEQNVTIPTVHVLPSDNLALQEFNIPNDADYNQDRLKVANETPNNKQHWFKHKDLRNEYNMPLVIPIPAFIILDAFDKDIDSVVIFEHIMSLPPDDKLPEATKTFILNFLKATVVKSTVTENNVEPRIPILLTAYTASKQMEIHLFETNAPHPYQSTSF